MDETLKLYLGCGEKYLQGYRNIDFPILNHSVQAKSVADKLIDIRLLKFSPISITEVRPHHLFEHFDRVESLVLHPHGTNDYW